MSAVLTVEGLQITIDGLKEVSPGLNVTMAWAYAAVPVCSFTGLLFAIEKLVDQFNGRVEPPVLVEGLI
jgi:TRAP-type C4-dicarboxylate transport system permease small subunit